MKFEPQEITDVMHAFPGNVSHLMPVYEDIPSEFHKCNSPWSTLASAWFYEGLDKDARFYAKDGIDAQKAVKHVHTIMRSWQPKHEHRIAACAYLLSLWFDKIEFPTKTQP